MLGAVQNLVPGRDTGNSYWRLPLAAEDTQGQHRKFVGGTHTQTFEEAETPVDLLGK